MLGLTTAGAGRLKSLRRSKLYDLLAALPLIAWCAFWGARMLPTLVQQMMLVKLFIQTDPTVLPIDLVLSLISKLASLAYLAFLIVFFAIRYIPQASAPGLHPRFAALAGTYLSASIVLLPRGFLPRNATAAMNLGGESNAQVWTAFGQLPSSQQDILALDIFYLVLRDAGRDHNISSSPGFGNYAAGYAAVSALFPGSQWQGHGHTTG